MKCSGIARCIILCLAVAACATAGEPASVPGKAFAQPEDVVAAFAELVGEGDFGAAVELFDARERAKRYDFRALAKRMQAIVPNMMEPSEYSGFAALNGIKEQAHAARQIAVLVYSMLLPDEFEKYIDMKPMSLKDDMELSDRFFVAANPAGLKGLRLERLVYANPEMQDGETYRDIIRRNSALYGYVDCKDYIAIYELNGDHYAGGMQVTNYGDGWRIAGLQSPLAGTPATGRVAKVDEAFPLP